ncbi:MAG: hypothetical protein A3F40_00490 [Chlamydiae bacterium RIFCSPHIGHO2_12_FULL_27_8]|nr:MAG: hypothetical protein A3F40_00490 [Chlamydiae bacterium RIFCSPHIGHO2_12_FULL_27_8]
MKQIDKLKIKFNYLDDLEIPKDIEKSFKKDWSKFYKNSKKNYYSKTRRVQFKNFLKRIKKQKIDKDNFKKINIKYISPYMGYGVFAKENIPPYKILNQYTGILKLDKKIGVNNNSTFCFPDFKKYSIDGKKQGNWTRFMNHSHKANIIVWEFYDKERPYIIFTSGSRGIKKNHELVYSYGDLYWREEDNI